jgi:ribosomal protein L31
MEREMKDEEGTLSMLFVEVISIDVWRNVSPAFFRRKKETNSHRKVVEFKKEGSRKTE